MENITKQIWFKDSNNHDRPHRLHYIETGKPFYQQSDCGILPFVKISQEGAICKVVAIGSCYEYDVCMGVEYTMRSRVNAHPLSHEKAFAILFKEMSKEWKRKKMLK